MGGDALKAWKPHQPKSEEKSAILSIIVPRILFFRFLGKLWKEVKSDSHKEY